MTYRARQANVTRRVLRGFDADRFRKRRLELNLTRADLGRLADISPAAVTAWEQGRRKPQVDTLARAAAVLQSPLEVLVHVPRDQRYVGDLRVIRGLTQPALAMKVGVSTATLGAIERGEVRLTPSTTAALAEVLDSSPEEVFRAWQRARSRPAGAPA